MISQKKNKINTKIQNDILAKKLNIYIAEYNALQFEMLENIEKKFNERKCASGSFKNMNKKLKQINANDSDFLWGIDEDDNVLKCKKPCNNNDWEKIRGKIDQIDVENNTSNNLWGINKNGNIRNWIDDENKWKKIKGLLNYITVTGKNNLWGLKKNSKHEVEIVKCKKPCLGNWNIDSPNVEKIDITVGSSGYYIKEITLPRSGITVSNIPVNNQQASSSIAFSVSVKGDKLIVTRIDTSQGWEQNLILRGEYVEGNAPKLTFIKADDDFVYGIDKDKKLWYKNEDGTGNWNLFTNKIIHSSNQVGNFSWIDTNNENMLMGISNNEVVRLNKKKSNKCWKKINNLGDNKIQVTSDPQNNKIYTIDDQNNTNQFTLPNRNYFWRDLKNKNLMDKSDLKKAGDENEDYYYLGKAANLNECKLESIKSGEDFKNIIYYSDDSPWNKMCYGNFNDKSDFTIKQTNVTSSIAPNNNTFLLGNDVYNLIDRMEKKSKQIDCIIKKLENNNYDFKVEPVSQINKKNNYDPVQKMLKREELNDVVNKIQNNRIEINKIIQNSQDSAEKESMSLIMKSNFLMYIYWILILTVSIYLIFYIYYTQSENISFMVYIFIAIWILVLFRLYYRVVKDTSQKALDDFTSYLVG